MPADSPSNDTSTAEPSAPRWRAAAPVSAVLLTTLVTALLFLQTKGLGLMGHDSYPIALTARIESLGDLLGTFTEELMDGRYAGDFYRPLLNLTFALDYAIGGIEPMVYQLTSALIFAATALALYLLARRLCGEGAVWGPLLALVVLLLHETQLEVLPVPPRRPELLCALFAFLSFSSQLREKELARRFSWRPAAWMALAALSKETALVMPAFSFVLVWLYSTERGTRERTLHALRAIVAHAAVIALLVGVRFAVLGGLGGPGPTPPGAEPLPAPQLLGRLVVALLAPASWAGFRTSILVLAALLVFLVVSLVLRRWLLARTRAAEPADPAPARGLVFAAGWFVGLCAVYALTGKVERWYFFLPVTGVCLLAGAVLELLLRSARVDDAGTKLRARAGVVLLAVFVFLQVRYSPLFHHYSEWERATAASDEFFDELESRLAQAQPGKAIDAPPLPVWVDPSVEGAAILGGAVLSDYSVQAWCELVHPEREVRVISRPDAPPPGPDEVVVMVRRVREGFAPGLPRPR